jgi:hypothetical protein
MGIILSLIVGAAIGALVKSLSSGSRKRWSFATSVFLTFMGGMLGALVADMPPLELSLAGVVGTLLGALFAFLMGIGGRAPRRRPPVRRVMVEFRRSPSYG